MGLPLLRHLELDAVLLERGEVEAVASAAASMVAATSADP